MKLLLANIVDLACTINEAFWMWKFDGNIFDGSNRRR